jgi:hypothetical protein
MSSWSLQHKSASCRFCEDVPHDAYRRHWKHEPKAGYWHVIAEGPGLVGNLPRQAHFVTILAYQVGPDGFPAHYYGPFYAEFDAEDTAQALSDIRRCVELLHITYDCPLEAPHIWHSGGRGFHITIPPLVLGAEAGHPQLPRLYADMIQQLFPLQVAPTLDRSVYSMGRGRMWRLPNRRRTDTGRHKVPLSIREVLHKPHGDLEGLTLRPRKGVFWPPDEDLSPCPGLVQLYQETLSAIERHLAHSRLHVRPRDTLRGHAGVLFHAFGMRGWLGQEIEPGKWAVTCPWEGEHTKGEHLDTSTILFAPGDGAVTGWFHCSHGHCADRTLEDVLSLFTSGELTAAKVAAGLTGHDWHMRHVLRRRREAEEIARTILSKRQGGVAG